MMDGFLGFRMGDVASSGSSTSRFLIWTQSCSPRGIQRFWNLRGHVLQQAAWPKGLGGGPRTAEMDLS